MQQHTVSPSIPLCSHNAGKMPYVRLEDGSVLTDTELIMDELELQRPWLAEAGLTAEQRAMGRVLRRMVDEALYWTVVWLR